MECHWAHDLPAFAGCHLQLLPLKRQHAGHEAQAHRVKVTVGVGALYKGKIGLPPLSPFPKLNEFPQIPKVVFFKPLGFNQVPGTGILSTANSLCNEKQLGSRWAMNHDQQLPVCLFSQADIKWLDKKFCGFSSDENCTFWVSLTCWLAWVRGRRGWWCHNTLAGGSHSIVKVMVEGVCPLLLCYFGSNSLKLMLRVPGTSSLCQSLSPLGTHEFTPNSQISFFIFQFPNQKKTYKGIEKEQSVNTVYPLSALVTASFQMVLQGRSWNKASWII